MVPVLIVVIVFVVGLLLIVRMYNGVVRMRNQVDQAWAQIDVQLRRRHDLIPNLVGAVKGYMGFEQQVLTDVTSARAAAVAAGAAGPLQQAAAENALSATLRSLFAVVERYPDLKASQNVVSLQGQLATAENMISGARDAYNAAVRSFNTAIQSFPMVLMAGMMGFTRREFFAAEPAAAATPTVQLR